eukprot:GHVL01010452.1.p1 GENE.GHVL01010452.1~~GHVL01010452.1.p1  ORF type:complete len:367 (+),score=46.01 GHVL01010452.1:62-1102(+)
MRRFLFLSALILVAGRDFYKILEIKRSATLGEIKKSYRKLSLKWHPDKNPDEKAKERFADIAEAYEVLSDDEKKKTYDRHGEEGLKQMNAQRGHDPFDIFSQFGFGSRGASHNEPRSPDVRLKLRLSLKEMYLGDLFDVAYRRQVLCMNIDECEIERSDCHGPGVKVTTQAIGPGFFVQNQQQDSSCVGPGKGWENKCSACPKGVTETEKVNISLSIDKGAKDGEKIIFNGLADQNIGHTPGDLVFEIEEVAQDTFTRKGDDLWMDMTISLVDALTGFKKEIKHIDDSIVILERNEVTHYDQVVRIANKGMPQKGSTTFGSIYVKMKVTFPKTITNKEQIRKALSG